VILKTVPGRSNDELDADEAKQGRCDRQRYEAVTKVLRSI
jgi:hypothetical protein